jgi:PDZ domain
MKSSGASSRPAHWALISALATAALAVGVCVSLPTSIVAAPSPVAEASTPASAPSADTRATPNAPSNLVATPPDVGATPPSTTEIPPASPPPYMTPEPPKITSDTIPFTESGEVARYQQEQSGMPPQQLKDLQEFVSEGAISSPIGMELREARRTLKSGEEADGLLVMDVKKGSAAASAGVHAYTRTTHNVITGAAMAAAMIFPPAILIVPALDYTQLGESYDLIIGVDGSRVTNFLDFQDKMRDVQPGELIYFSIVRDGKRIQISVPVPPNIAQVTY